MSDLQPPQPDRNAPLTPERKAQADRARVWMLKMIEQGRAKEADSLPDDGPSSIETPRVNDDNDSPYVWFARPLFFLFFLSIATGGLVDLYGRDPRNIGLDEVGLNIEFALVVIGAGTVFAGVLTLFHRIGWLDDDRVGVVERWQLNRHMKRLRALPASEREAYIRRHKVTPFRPKI